MALSAKQKRIKERLERIKEMASRTQMELAASKSANSASGKALAPTLGLAEEAAGLGLELLEEAK